MSKKTAPTMSKVTRKIAETSLVKDKDRKKKVGRPKSDRAIKEIDLALLKQTVLLDNVEALIEQKQKTLTEGVKELTIPYTPSKHQQEVHKLLEKSRFGVVVVHRGWGKTRLAANELIRRAWACTAPQGW